MTQHIQRMHSRMEAREQVAAVALGVFLIALLIALCGCQAVTYKITVRDSQHATITIPGDAEIAKPIEVSPGREISPSADVSPTTELDTVLDVEAPNWQIEGIPNL